MYIFFQLAFLSLGIYALEQSFFFTISSFLIDNYQYISFPYGIAQTILAFCFGLFSSLIIPNKIRLPLLYRFICLSIALVFVYNIDRFAFFQYYIQL